MSIYTKVGDQGSTRYPDGRLARKSEPTLVAIGALDELNCHLGLCLCQARNNDFVEIADALAPVQPQLMVLCATLVHASGHGRPPALNESVVRRTEKIIDEISAALEPLKNLVLPGGSELACRLHIARAVCRRAERDLVTANDSQTLVEPVGMMFINRLSDLLFCLARLANHQSGATEAIWKI